MPEILGVQHLRQPQSVDMVHQKARVRKMAHRLRPGQIVRPEYVVGTDAFSMLVVLGDIVHEPLGDVPVSAERYDFGSQYLCLSLHPHRLRPFLLYQSHRFGVHRSPGESLSLDAADENSQRALFLNFPRKNMARDCQFTFAFDIICIFLVLPSNVSLGMLTLYPFRGT